MATPSKKRLWSRWITRMTGKECQGLAKANRRTRPLRIELLEDRSVPAVGASFYPTTVNSGTGFDGVVNFDDGCTGVLLYDGRHVLTAAHCVDGAAARDGLVDNETFTVTFEVPNGDETFTMTATVAASRITIHPGWVANPGSSGGNDLAIIELDDTFGREEIATGGRSNGFDLYRNTDEVGQTYTLIGYGRANNDGNLGAELPSGPGLPTGAQDVGTKRQSSNVFEANGSRLLDEVNSIEVVATGGTFTLTLDSNTTGNIAFNATGAQVQTALEGLSNVDPGDVEVFGSPGLWFVHFTGNLAATNVDLDIDDTNLTGVTTADVDTEIDGGDYTFSANNVLLYDFDDGTAAHDALGQLYGLTDLGLGNTTESIQAAGDSGGPFFLGNLIAGLVSTRKTQLGRGSDAIATPIDVSDNDSTFGEIGIVTRISSFQAWIDAQIDDSNLDLVLDMTHQNEGDDGSADSILATVNAGLFELYVNSVLYYQDSLADISSLRILGSSDDEEITIAASVSIAQIIVDGRDGSDTSNITLNGSGSRTITLSDTGTSGTDATTIDGTAVVDAFVVSATGVTLAGENVVYDGNLESVTVNGLDGADTFDVTGSASTAFTINGGDPGASPGDALTYTGTGTATLTFNGPGNGTISETGLQPVTYTGIEECPDFVGVTVNVVLDAGVDAGDGTRDTFTVRRDGGHLEIFANGGTPQDACLDFADVSAVTLNGSSDDDVFDLDNSGGLLNIEINVNGAGGTNTLNVVGDAGVPIRRETLAVTATGDGAIIFDPDDSGGIGAIAATLGDDAEEINFTGITVIHDVKPLDTGVTPGQLDVFLPGYANAIGIGDGPLFDGFVTTEIDGAAPSIRFANKPAVTVNGLSGADTFTIDVRHPADGLLDLKVYGNDLTGGALSVYDPTWADDDAGDTFNIKAVEVPTAVFGQGGDDTFNVYLTAAAAITIDGGAGTGDLLNDESHTDNTFTVTGPNQGYTDVVDSFVNVESLSGDNHEDSFVFLPGGSLGGNIDGEGHIDTLDYSLFNLAVTTNLETDTTTAVGGTFSNIETLIGTVLSDKLIGENNINDWTIDGPNQGAVDAFFHFFSIENLQGGTARDVFHFLGDGRVSGKIDGQAGPDWLDYTALPSGVVVNLTARTATRTGGVLGLENVLGSANGSDVLVGDAVNNIFIAHGTRNFLHGMAGRDLLVGGVGQGRINGGLGDDLLISGNTAFDDNFDALEAIMKEWSRPIGFAARSLNVQTGGGLAGGFGLQLGTTVFLSSLPPGPRYGRGGGFYNNTVIGSFGQDLFFVQWASLIADFNRILDRIVKPV